MNNEQTNLVEEILPSTPNNDGIVKIKDPLFGMDVAFKVFKVEGITHIYRTRWCPKCECLVPSVKYCTISKSGIKRFHEENRWAL